MFQPMPPHPVLSSSTRAIRRKRDARQQGVTILEWLTAMSILLIATTAIIGMQSTTLQAHKISDDLIVANNIALQTSEVLQIDALRWRQNLTESLYFQATPATVGSPNWRAMTFAPINFQWSSRNDETISPLSSWNSLTTTDEEHTYARANYCVFYTYRWAGSDSPGVTRQGFIGVRPAGQDELLEVTVAVTWPYTTRGLTATLRTFHDSCGAPAGSFDSNLINTTIGSGPTLIASGAAGLLRQVRHSFFVRRDLAGGM